MVDIIVYGTVWCSDCLIVKRFFDRNSISYQFVNIDQDKKAEEFVLKTNRGMRSVPTIIFPDGSILVEPSKNTLAKKMGIV